jgi:branched-chain amino acid aminotransferase
MAIIQVEKIMQEDSSHARLPHDVRFEGGSAFMNGEYVGIHEATVPIVDMGFMHADAAYDVVTVSGGAFFRLDDHLERMEASCKKFRLENPYGREEVRKILSELVRLSGLRDAYVWWCVTRGLMSGGDRSNLDHYQNCLYAFAIPYLFIADDEKRNRGLDLIISKQYIRIPAKAVDPTAKNFHWMDMKLSLFEARDQGKDWSVLVDSEGYLTESPGANIFLVKNGELFTPDTGCLEGVTRKSVLELAAEAGVKANVVRLPKEALLEADEAFTSTSAGGISPINSVDGLVLGGATGYGPLTEKLHNLYWERRWSGWHATPVEYS